MTTAATAAAGVLHREVHHTEEAVRHRIREALLPTTTGTAPTVREDPHPIPREEVRYHAAAALYRVAADPSPAAAEVPYQEDDR